MISFIPRPDGGLIKIGTTIRLSQRLKQLVAEYGEGLEVLAVVEGDRDGEQELHRRFEHLNVVNEWFEPGDDLVGFIVSDGKPWDGSDDVHGIDIRLRVDAEFQKRVQAAADQEGNSVAAFIRTAVVEKLKRIETTTPSGESWYDDRVVGTFADPEARRAHEAQGVKKMIYFITLKGSEACRDWLPDFTKMTRIPAVSLVRLGLANQARKHGYEVPHPRNEGASP